MASIKEDTIIHLDFTVEPPCDSGVHEAASNHSGPAGFWQDGPCVHSTGFRCSEYVEFAKWLAGADDWMECLTCDTVHRASVLRFTAI